MNLALHGLDSGIHDGVVRHVGQGDVVLSLVELVVLRSGAQSVLVAGPGAAGHTHHNVPRHGHLQDVVHTLGAVQNHAEAAVDGLADAHAAAVVQGDQAHAAGSVAGVALGSHIRHDVGAVLDVGGLTEGGVGSAGIVVVAAQHDGADLAVADHLVELQSDVHAAHGVGVQYPALRAYYHLVLFRITQPYVVVVILIAAVVVLDVLGGSSVGLVQVLGLPGQAAPTEGAVAVVEQEGAKDIFHVGGEDKAVQVVLRKQENKRMQNLLQNKRALDKQKKIALSVADKIEFVEIGSIVRCESESNYTTFYLKSGEKLIVSKTLKEFDDLLTPYNFLRIHQSHLINLEEIKSFIKSDGGYIRMKDGSSISISRQRRNYVMEVLKQL